MGKVTYVIVVLMTPDSYLIKKSFKFLTPPHKKRNSLDRKPWKRLLKNNEEDIEP